MIVDSNLIIYAAQNQHAAIRTFLAQPGLAASTISLVEVLGFHGLRPEDEPVLRALFSRFQVLAIDGQVIDQAVRLRQQRRMSLGDAIIAGTALVHGRGLATRNIDDFRWIEGLTLRDPFAAP